MGAPALAITRLCFAIPGRSCFPKHVWEALVLGGVHGAVVQKVWETLDKTQPNWLLELTSSFM